MTTPTISDLTFTDILHNPEGIVPFLSTDDIKRILIEAILAYLDNVIDYTIIQRVGETLQQFPITDKQTLSVVTSLTSLSFCAESPCPMDTTKSTVREILGELII